MKSIRAYYELLDEKNELYYTPSTKTYRLDSMSNSVAYGTPQDYKIIPSILNEYAYYFSSFSPKRLDGERLNGWKNFNVYIPNYLLENFSLKTILEEKFKENNLEFSVWYWQEDNYPKDGNYIWYLQKIAIPYEKYLELYNKAKEVSNNE